MALTETIAQYTQRVRLDKDVITHVHRLVG